MENFELIKYGLIFIGIALILLVLFISYKTDNSQADMVEEDEKKDDDCENIEIDEEQSLYSSFDEEELVKDELDLSNFNLETEQLKENNVDTNFFADDYTIKTEVNEIPNDFEFDEIMNEPIKNNILEEIHNNQADNNETENKKIIDYENNFEYEESFINKIDENTDSQNNLSNLDNKMSNSYSNEDFFQTADYSNNEFFSNEIHSIDIFSDINDTKPDDYLEQPVQNQYNEETDTFSFSEDEPIEKFVDETFQYKTTDSNKEDLTGFFTTGVDNGESENIQDSIEVNLKTKRGKKKKTEEENVDKKSTKKTSTRKTTKNKKEEKTPEKSATKKTTTRKSTKKSEDEEKPAKKATTGKSTKKSEDEEKPAKEATAKKTTTKKTTRKKKEE